MVPTVTPTPRGAIDEDCSSTLNYVLYRSGERPIAEIVADNPLAQDYVHWGAPGPGRWVTIYATDAPTPHVFVVVIAGLRWDAAPTAPTSARPRRRRPALAHPQLHPDLGALVGAPSAGVVVCPAWRTARSTIC